MTFEISLCNGRTFACQADQTLLQAALSQSLVLEHSCRIGSCGVCKARVLNGTSEPLRPEIALQDDDRDAGFVLTCCRTATSDLALDVEDIGRLKGIVARTLPARISAIEPLAEGVVRVLLRLPPNAGFTYLPGQFIDVIWGGARRSYSLASASRADGLLELHIRAFEGGLMTSYWFGKAVVNDLLRVEGPLGTFHMRDRPASRVVFLATGTGIAPVKAMIEERRDHERKSAPPVDIFWGNRTAADFYWEPPALPGLGFNRVVSRPDAALAGAPGYVQDILLSGPFDPAGTIVYACGSPAMIEAARHRLAEVGAPSINFYYDAFVESGR